MRKHTFWHVRQTKTQISLRIRAVWLESSCCSHEESLQPWTSEILLVKILIKRRECGSEGAFSDVAALKVRFRTVRLWRYVFGRCGYKGTFSDVPAQKVRFPTLRLWRYVFGRCGSEGRFSDVATLKIRFRTLQLRRYVFGRCGSEGTFSDVATLKVF